MATIDSLRKSIIQMGRAELMDLLHTIRTNRRRRPEKALRAKKDTPAKVARAPKKGNLKQQDLFAFAKGMTSEAKNKLAAELMKGLL